MGAAERLQLEGKDWFTEPEAAVYCGVGISTFREGYRMLGIKPRRFLGKKLYSRLELNDAIRNSPAWQTSSNAENHGSSVGARAAGNSDDLSARLQPVRLRKFVPRKKPS